jgi:hypothetical protein
MIAMTRPVTIAKTPIQSRSRGAGAGSLATGPRGHQLGAAGLARALPTPRSWDTAVMRAGTHRTILMELPAALSDARMAASRRSTRFALKAPS